MEPDLAVQTLDRLSDAIPSSARSVLQGDWLGHPLHPMLTDLPIGFWTSSFVFDFLGRRGRAASALMVGLGVASAVPTIAAGVADFRELPNQKKPAGALHMACNAAATGLYTMSLVARMKKMHVRGVAFGLAGAAAAATAGYLGGHLVFGASEATANHDAPVIDDRQLRMAV